MSQFKETVLLVRDTVVCAYDGRSVGKAEYANVVIEWPNGKPEDESSPYREYGVWRIANPILADVEP